MRRLYTLLFYCLLPLIFFRLWKKGAKLPAYRDRWRERKGKIASLATDKKILWFHTVSVGEFIAATPLIQHYIDSADYCVYVTTTTPTGSERVLKTFGSKVHHSYLPYDVPLYLNRFLKACHPAILICLETELWPNLLHACRKHAIPVVLANARMSEKSATGYRRFSALTRPMLSAISAGAVQNDEDAQRLIELGLTKGNTQVIGNIKFDLELGEQLRAQAVRLKRAISLDGKYVVWIAASTHRGEDQIVLDAFSRLKQQGHAVRLMLVPRHPERFIDVYQLCQNTEFSVARRSEHPANDSEIEADILLCDTLGELMMLYGAADMAFVGGSLIDNGGHNYIEPAAWGMPIVSGPSTFNFREIAQSFIDAGAMQTVTDANTMAETLATLIENPKSRADRGAAAKQLAEKNKGALTKLIGLIDEQLSRISK